MKILTSAQMKRMDRRAVEEFGIIGPILMENAGLEITRAILRRFPRIQEQAVVIAAGKGNNGGDGFVVARHLFNRGCRPRVMLMGKVRDLQGDARLNADIAVRMGVDIEEITTANIWRKARGALANSTLVVDAIFGTGLTKPARGIYAEVIEAINATAAYTVAVDIPSGLSADSFQILGPCVRADLTVTMAAPKIAHVFPPAEERVGELEIADISMPRQMFFDDALKLEMVEEDSLLPYFEDRVRDTHKGTFGHLLVLSGSLGKTGAAVMAGKAALKMGAGLVTVGTPRSCLPAVARGMAELMAEPLEETVEGALDQAAESRILKLLSGKDALMLGPGISTQPPTRDLVLSLLPKVKIPMVLDADALNILADAPDVLKSITPAVILTPHPGEFARLLHIPTKKILTDKLELVPRFAQENGVFLVLEGYRTLIATPEGKVFINPTGNPGMATGGSGDVLSGMIGSMIMQEDSIGDAVLAAVYVHGLSGDLAAKRVGERSLVAGDIIRTLPRAVKALTTRRA